MNKILEKYQTKSIHSSIAHDGVFSHTYYAEVIINYSSSTFSIQYFKTSVNNPIEEIKNWRNKERDIFQELNKEVYTIVETCFKKEKE